MTTLLSASWRWWQARWRRDAAHQALDQPAVGDCVRCGHHPDDHGPAGCTATVNLDGVGMGGCDCPNYVAPAP